MRNSVPTGNPWGDIVGYSRAVRVATGFSCRARPRVVPRDKRCIPASRAADAAHPRPHRRCVGEARSLVEGRGRNAHLCARHRPVGSSGQGATAEVFADIRPATTLVEVSQLIASDLLVEIAAMAVVTRRHDTVVVALKPSERGYAAPSPLSSSGRWCRWVRDSLFCASIPTSST